MNFGQNAAKCSKKFISCKKENRNEKRKQKNKKVKKQNESPTSTEQTHEKRLENKKEKNI